MYQESINSLVLTHSPSEAFYLLMVSESCC